MRPYKWALVGLKLDDLDITTLHYAGMVGRLAEASKMYCAHVVEIPEVPEEARALHLVPKQANDDWHFRNGAGWRPMARTVRPAVCDGCVALCFFLYQA